jgi:hypothetical protein
MTFAVLDLKFLLTGDAVGIRCADTSSTQLHAEKKAKNAENADRLHKNTLAD